MKVKICGLNNQQNVNQLRHLDMDFLGFIFYEKSKRSIKKGDLNKNFVKSVNTAKRVGVFVDEVIEHVIETAKDYQLGYIQLHGNESPEYCQKLKEKGLNVIKAIPVMDELPIDILATYEKTVDLFLFDTLGKEKGGNGEKFDWEVLKNYRLNVPFLLAGGIDSQDASMIKELRLEMLHGVDLNSKFEIEPGKKDVKKVKQFIEEING